MTSEPDSAAPVSQTPNETVVSPSGHEPPPSTAGHPSKLLVLALTSLGVVYGDIGTSPLYAMRECFLGEHELAATPEHVLGVLSLILWALIVVISLKYLLYIMRADNQGEGGVLALLALAQPDRRKARGYRVALVVMGVFGAALLYGDGMITPAISVLSAVEGLEVVTPVFSPYVVPITIIILVALFMFQSHGTARVGILFGPVTLLWFTVLAVLGVRGILMEPGVLKAVNPWYAAVFFVHAGWTGYLVLGAVFLVVTGGEALYADMGHFGKRPIRLAWFVVVLPALLLNYFGQGALVLSDPAEIHHPFFHLAPRWALWPMVVLAMMATIIASQAVISGAFSLTRQAVQLGELPRMRIVQTSSDQIGQIYIPLVNWLLMVAAIGLVIGFGDSSGLAAAYGVAVTTTMVITTILAFFVARERWRWPAGVVWPITLALLCVDLSFFGANMLKFADGGWFPLLIGGAVFVVMSTWRHGNHLIRLRSRDQQRPVETLLQSLRIDAPARTEGTDVFMAGRSDGTPAVLLHHLKLNQVLSKRVMLITVAIEQQAHVKLAERFEHEDLGEGFHRLILHYGFMDHPDVPRALRQVAAEQDLDIIPEMTTYYVGRQTLVVIDSEQWMAKWRQALFDFLSRNASRPMATFDLPPDRVVELGVSVRV